MDGRGEAVRLSFTAVSASFFEVLGARPMLGRTFRAEDDVANAAGVIVLSHDTWIRRFGGDPNIVGNTAILRAMQSLLGCQCQRCAVRCYTSRAACAGHRLGRPRREGIPIRQLRWETGR